MANENAKNKITNNENKSSTIKSLLKIIILVSIAATAISSRLFSVIRYESIIHEFDPWFNL